MTRQAVRAVAISVLAVAASAVIAGWLWVSWWLFPGSTKRRR